MVMTKMIDLRSGYLRAQLPCNGKKVSKKRAAEKMMEELKRLPPLSVAMLRPARIKNAQSKKKSKNLIKLIDEQGPAHKKTFQVQLKLGDAEEYTAEGASIKKAQHSAAAMALEQTKMRHPPVRYESRRFPRQYMNVTPTEELNALAMRRGELALYRQIDPPRHPPYNVPNLDFRGIYNQR
ncbi:PREDICTED: double-stranded RNA-binding protein Staufen homolog 2-like [Priapulus caudatus]|uniref:Double-stranded RNA-binding protein Staufen homolog 2-like n=1 Tax=Priapulus caudatus TaxID=37621 RepID=A0ABM1F3P8_PRICU|nr:PREDICTED: double-stranded RNA-binding protein Staufen homolog 2-like [Priapulus caudatus]